MPSPLARLERSFYTHFVMGKRDEIAAAADELFYREGFANVGIDKVVAKAGTALGTLYKTFGGRTGLVIAAMDHREAAFFGNLSAGAERLQGAERVLDLFDGLRRWSQQRGGNGCFFLRAAAAHPHEPAVRRRALAHKRAYLDLIVTRLREGGWSGPQAKRLAPAIYLFLEGAVAAVPVLGIERAIREGRTAGADLLASSRRQP